MKMPAAILNKSDTCITKRMNNCFSYSCNKPMLKLAVGCLFVFRFLCQPKNEFHPTVYIVIFCQTLIAFYTLYKFSCFLRCL